MGFFKKFKEAWLASMTFDKLDDEFYEELEEALILADIGASTAADTVAQLRKRVSQKLLTRADEVKDALRDILAEKLDVGDTALRGAAPTRLAWAGAGAGLLAGALGALAYALHCPEMAAPFLAVWYLAGMALPTLAGAWLGPRVLRW